MALHLPPSGPVFDPPAIVQAAPAWALRGPVAALLDSYKVPESVAAFYQAAADRRLILHESIVFPMTFWASNSSYVNSVQQVSITITAGTSNTGTVNVVNANAFPIWQGFTAVGATADAATSSPRVTYSTSGGVMTLTATLNSSGTCTVNVTVVDPLATLVTAMGHGTITITAGTSNTATGLSLSATLSSVFYLGQSSTTTNKLACMNVVSSGVTVTNTTTLTANLNTAATITLAYATVTWAAGALKSNVQQFVTTKSTLTSNTQAVTSVTAANSIIAWGGLTTSNSATNMSPVPYVVLTDGTTMTFTTNATAAFTAYTTLIEFVPGVLKSSQYGNVAISASTSGTTTPGTAVTTSKAACAFLGATLGTGSTDATTNTRITLTNGTPTVTANVNTSSSPTAGFGLYEFN